MSVQCETTGKKAAGAPMGLFERYLTVWVFLCIGAGILLGQLLPGLFHAIGAMEVVHVNLPVALLIWLMKTICTNKRAFKLHAQLLFYSWPQDAF